MFWKSGLVYLKSEGEEKRYFRICIYFENGCLWYCIRVGEKCICIIFHFRCCWPVCADAGFIWSLLRLEIYDWLDNTRMPERRSDMGRLVPAIFSTIQMIRACNSSHSSWCLVRVGRKMIRFAHPSLDWGSPGEQVFPVLSASSPSLFITEGDESLTSLGEDLKSNQVTSVLFM